MVVFFFYEMLPSCYDGSGFLSAAVSKVVTVLVCLVRLPRNCIAGGNMQKEEINPSSGTDSLDFGISELTSTMRCFIQVKT